MATSPDSFFSREYSASFVLTDEGRDMLHRNLVINEGRDDFHMTAIDTLRAFANHNGEAYHHGQWEPAARDATALSRACSRTQIQDNSGVLSHENTFTLDNFRILGGFPNNTLEVGSAEKKFDWYGGCHRCYQFSMLFGTAPNSIGQINNEEDFEKYKMQFVDHYNEKHKDLYEWRKKKIGKKPITSQENIESLKGRMNSQATISSMSFLIPTDAGRTVTIENIAGIDLVTTPRPEITDEDHAVIWELEATGDITDEDKERLNMKYGESIIINALKKYRDRTTPRRGFRAGRAPRRIEHRIENGVYSVTSSDVNRSSV